MNIDYNAIGKRIKNARKKQHLTQERLAEMADISIPYLSNIENANTRVGLNVLLSIANALNVSMDELCCDNLNSAENIYISSISDSLKNCSNYELRVAENVLKELISSLKECKHIIENENNG